MKLKNKSKIFIMALILLISLVSVQAAFAADADSNINSISLDFSAIVEDVDSTSDVQAIEVDDSKASSDDTNILADGVGTDDKIYVKENGSDEGSGNATSPYKSISKAVEKNKELGGGKTIYVSNGKYIFDSRVDISDSVSIVGESNKVIFDGNNKSGFFYMNYSTSVSINGITFTNAFSLDKNGDYSPSGIAIYSNKAKLNLTNCIFENHTMLFSDNSANGLIYASGSDYYGSYLNVVSCTFKNILMNSTYNDKGAAIYSYGCNLYVNDCIFDNCTTDNFKGDKGCSGGAIHLNTNTKTVFINNTKFTNCNSYDGGAISAYYGAYNLTISNCNFTDCNAKGHGGAIYDEGSSYDVNKFTITLINNQYTHCIANGTTEPIYLKNVKEINPNSNVELHGKDINCYVSADGNYTVTLKTKSGEGIVGRDIKIVFINRYTQKVVVNTTITTDLNGVAIYPLKEIPVGRHAVFTSFAGDSDYTACNNTNLVNIADRYYGGLIVEPSNITIKEGDSYIITVYAVDSYNEPTNAYNNYAVQISYLKHSIVGNRLNGKSLKYDITDLGLPSNDEPYVVTFKLQDSNSYGGYKNGTIIVKVTGGLPDKIVDVPIIYVDATNGNDKTGNGTEENPYKSIRTAIEVNNALGGGKTVFIKNGEYTLAGYTLKKDVKVIGENPEKVIVSQSNGHHGMIFVNNGIEASFENMSFTNAYNTLMPYGGVFSNYYDSTLNLTNCRFYNNTGMDGGVIYTNGAGTTNIVNCSFFNNTCLKLGSAGAIYAWSSPDKAMGTLKIVNSIFDGNVGKESGGAIVNNGQNLIIIGSTFKNNFADTNKELSAALMGGGAIYIQRGPTNIINTTFLNNKANNYGAAIYALSGFNMTGCVLINNTSPKDGGIYIEYSKDPTNISNSVLIGNGVLKYNQNYDTVVIANGNWFGTNSASFSCDYYVKMTYKFKKDGDGFKIIISFKYVDQKGIESSIVGYFPSRYISLKATSGTLAETEGNLVNNEFITHYTPTSADNIGTISATIDSCTVKFTPEYHSYVFINGVAYESLEDAIADAKDGDIIKVIAGTYNIESPMIIDKNITIIQNSTDAKVILNGIKQIFNVKNNGTLNIVGITLTNGKATKGGAIYSEGTVNIADSIINSNNAENGGAIYAASGILNVNNTTFELNKADSAAAIYSNATTKLNGNKFVNNAAEDETLLIESVNKVLNTNTYENTKIGFTIKSDKVSTLYVGDVATITVSLNNPNYYDADLLNKTSFVVYLNNVEYTNSKNGTYNFNPQKDGNYTIYFLPNVSVKTNSMEFTVSKIPTSLELTIENTTFTNYTLIGGITDIHGYLVNEGSLNIFIKNESGVVVFDKTVDVKDGFGEVNFIATVGQYEVTAIYYSDKYENQKTIEYFVLNKVKTAITGKVPSVYEGESAVASIDTGFNDATGNVIIKLSNGREFRSSLSNGETQIIMFGLPNGNYIANVTYEGDSKYLGSKTTLNFNVMSKGINHTNDNKTEKIEIVAKDLTMYYKYGNKLVVKVLKDFKAFAGQTVNFIINNNKYNLTTNSNGQVFFSKTFAPGTYRTTISIVSNNKQYTKQVKIVVKKSPVKFKVAKSVKRGKYLKVRVLTGKNKAIKKQKVYIKIGKKTYKVKTDSNGYLKLKIKVSAKKYKVTYHLAKNKYYSSSEKKIALNVKR